MKKADITGFTLMELMITVAIVGILAAAVVYNMGEWLQKKNLDQATRVLYTNMQKSRLEAIRRNDTVKLSFDTASTPNRYIVKANTAGILIDWTSAPKDSITFTPAFSSVPSLASTTGFDQRGLALQTGTITVYCSKAPLNERTRIITLTIGGSSNITP